MPNKAELLEINARAASPGANCEGALAKSRLNFYCRFTADVLNITIAA